MKLGGIVTKALNKADWIAGIASVISRYGGTNIGHLMQDLPKEIEWLMKDPLIRIQYKLFTSPHLYTQLFKLGMMGWLAGQTGLVDAKWGKAGMKVMKGAGIAALVLPGSGPMPRGATGQNFASAKPIGAYQY